MVHNFIVDNLVLKWDKVPDWAFNDFLDELRFLSTFKKIPELPRPWVGKGFNTYHNNQNVGEGGGAMTFSWHPNAEPMRRIPDKETGEIHLIQSARVEFNPAKAELWHRLVMEKWHQQVGRFHEWRLDTVDMAIDLPVSTHSVFVLPLNGHRMTYFDGTRYFGGRGEDGHLKVYDKARELREKEGIEVEGPITRIEYKWRGKCTDPYKFNAHEEFRRRYYVLIYKGCDPVVRGLIYAINDGEISYDELPKRMKTKIKKALLSQQCLQTTFDHEHLKNILDLYYIK